MKAIRVQTIIGSIRARKDGSLAFSAETPELTKEEKVEFMGLQNAVLDTAFVPIDSEVVATIEVKTEARSKTQSQRIRAVLYRVWEQKNTGENFDEFYLKWTEKIINRLKDELE